MPRMVRRPARIGGRSLPDLLERLRSEEADIREGIYVRPDGAEGLHVVRFHCSTQEVVVSSALRGATFRPGSSVPLGSHAGDSQLSILSAPPPGQRGASGFAQPHGFSVSDRPLLISMSPEELAPDSSQTVAFVGANFSQTPVDVLTAVVYDETLLEWVADPFVTVTNPVTWVDAENITATVTVAAGAPEGRALWFDASRG